MRNRFPYFAQCRDLFADNPAISPSISVTGEAGLSGHALHEHQQTLLVRTRIEGQLRGSSREEIESEVQQLERTFSQGSEVTWESPNSTSVIESTTAKPPKSTPSSVHQTKQAKGKKMGAFEEEIVKSIANTNDLFRAYMQKPSEPQPTASLQQQVNELKTEIREIQNGQARIENLLKGLRRE